MEKVPTVQIAAPDPVTSAAAEVGASASEAGSVPKWVIAAAIGVPVAAALAYILFGPSSDSKPKSSKKKKKKEEIKEAPKADVNTTVKAKEEVGILAVISQTRVISDVEIFSGCFNRRC